MARKNTGVYYISALSCHTASCRTQQRWKQDQKYKTKTKTEADLRPRSCHKTAVSDPKTDVNNIFIGRTGTRVSNALACPLQYCANRNVFNWHL